MGFRFTLRTPSPIPLEAVGLLPERLAGLSALEVAKLSLLHGNRTEPVGEHFDISASDLADVHFAGDTRNVHGIGRGMTGGAVFIENVCGRHTGAQMSGGELIADAGVGDWVGAEMKGGSIEVRGTAGQHCGGVYPGSRRGMTGGTIRVRGHAGHEVGAKMRRGLIVVEGDRDLAGIDGDLAGARLDPDTGDRVLALAGGVSAALLVGLLDIFRSSIRYRLERAELIERLNGIGHNQAALVFLRFNDAMSMVSGCCASCG